MDSDTVTATRLKATLLGVLDEVARTGRPITVTKHGKPVADIIPHVHPDDEPVALFEQLVTDDELLEPLDVTWTWDSENLT